MWRNWLNRLSGLLGEASVESEPSVLQESPIAVAVDDDVVDDIIFLEGESPAAITIHTYIHTTYIHVSRGCRRATRHTQYWWGPISQNTCLLALHTPYHTCTNTCICIPEAVFFDENNAACAVPVFEVTLPFAALEPVFPVLLVLAAGLVGDLVTSNSAMSFLISSFSSSFSSGKPSKSAGVSIFLAVLALYNLRGLWLCEISIKVLGIHIFSV